MTTQVLSRGKKGDAKVAYGRERLEEVISTQAPVTREDTTLVTRLLPTREGWSSGKEAPWDSTAPPDRPMERNTEGPACHTRPLLGRGKRSPEAQARPHLELPEDEVGVEVELEGGDELQLLWETGRAAATTAGHLLSPASPLAPPPQHPRGPRPPAAASPRRDPRCPHHGGSGKHAGGGVGPRHGRHAQVLLREALVGHGAQRQRPAALRAL